MLQSLIMKYSSAALAKMPLKIKMRNWGINNLANFDILIFWKWKQIFFMIYLFNLKTSSE